jgi:hypothetical protein
MIFEFSIGGYPGPFFELKQKGAYLLFAVTPKHRIQREERLIAVLDNAQWDELLHYLSTKKWKGEYQREDIVDGTRWELRVETENFRLACSGSNAYPAGFKKFLRLLNTLTAKEGIAVY